MMVQSSSTFSWVTVSQRLAQVNFITKDFAHILPGGTPGNGSPATVGKHSGHICGENTGIDYAFEGAPSDSARLRFVGSSSSKLAELLRVEFPESTRMMACLRVLD